MKRNRRSAAARTMGSLLTSAALLSAAMAFLVFVLLTPGPPVLSGVLTLAVAGTDPAVIEDFTFADSFFGLISRGKPVLIDLYDTPTARFTAGDTAGEILSDGRGRFAVSIGGRKYRVDSEEYRALAVHEGLRPVLLALAPQALTLSLGGESFLLPPADSAWQYRCIDGEYYEYPPDNLCAQRRTAEGLMPTSISFSMPPENLHVTASLNGVTVFQADNQSYADFVPGEYGEYLLEARAEWDDELYKGVCVYRISVAYQKVVRFSISPQTTQPGEFVVLTAAGAEDSDVIEALSTLGAPCFYPIQGGMAALLPVHYSTSPGRYSVTLTLGAQTETLPLTVDPKAFETQHLTVSQSTLDSTVNSQKANAEYNQKITPLKSVSDPVLHGSGSFIMPVQGEITTEFGLLRYTNDDPTPTRHGGIDIASDRGTPVMAAQRGRVLFSAYIDLTGNTILLEHGFGLKTWYYHMDSLAVQSGDMVEQGQCIGCVGSTGFSTGPHLHFAASVGAVYVNPWTLMADGLKLS